MKPLRRSVTFWCGLFVIAFLVWAWVDSQWHRSEVVYYQAPYNEPYQLGVHGGMLVLNWTEGGYPPGYSVPRRAFPFAAWRRPDRLAMLWFPDFYGWWDGRRYFGWGGMTRAEIMKMREDPAKGFPLRTYHVQVPLWALLLGFILGWGSVLIWRRRRGRGKSAGLSG
ncbi:hypothetical protein OJ996_25725 [Luteolibacter sp. GHJ8]|uniref:DUF3592 domain-containing protein n=1 Tax=Luteolibacter rhizosphaerae TaxID=2989719 RepID=A0ABT3GCS2_9BACT|nr:hypothetical protein [Luteolibacter rhizosphaerae]MCW1917015.1 hypothetical protein [Luteolibacter rhizosphaerae]